MSAADWTPERVEKLIKLKGEGLTCSAIARELGGGVSRNAVIGKLVRLGVTGPARPAKPSLPGERRPPTVKPERTTKPRAPTRAREGAGGAPITFGGLGPGASLEELDALRAQRAQEQIARLEAVAAVLPGEEAVPLIGRGWGRCAWPVGVPARPAEQMCCGRPSGDASWCAAHRKIGRVPTPDMGSRYERALRRWL